MQSGMSECDVAIIGGGIVESWRWRAPPHEPRQIVVICGRRDKGQDGPGRGTRGPAACLARCWTRSTVC
ncbi:hypothetical protein DPM13_03640 [Paracoccus mutanolyticus]|uniref:Uncharacterized protein n=1 Tax=Paracoccus mutanolyticus TaxID=1499308 RepID=A0ABN5M5A2_9RHOB|nr:hypothetical protein DPM13_03640 [Paracoccus mutanolyticus]